MLQGAPCCPAGAAPEHPQAETPPHARPRAPWAACRHARTEHHTCRLDAEYQPPSRQPRSCVVVAAARAICMQDRRTAHKDALPVSARCAGSSSHAQQPSMHTAHTPPRARACIAAGERRCKTYDTATAHRTRHRQQQQLPRAQAGCERADAAKAEHLCLSNADSCWSKIEFMSKRVCCVTLTMCARARLTVPHITQSHTTQTAVLCCSRTAPMRMWG